MKVTALAITPPPSANGNPRVTPELLASSFARYSRSNKGIEAILATIDWEHPDKSVDAIFRFVDYGHASIGGLTGGIAIAIDNCSMLLAYKLFELAQLGDGQESSTRYITMSATNLPTPEEIGIPDHLTTAWQELMTNAFALYKEVYSELDSQAAAQPELVRVPKDADSKVIARLRKNYALDRARYFIPMATRTNVGLVMSARMWAYLIGQLDASPLLEANNCAKMLRSELEKFTPRLIRHSYKTDATTEQCSQELEFCRQAIISHGVPTDNLPDEVFVSIERSQPDFLPNFQNMKEAFAGKTNRYSPTGQLIRRMFVRFAWNNMALAELRDLNRHRSGHRFTPLTPVGFYLPSEIKQEKARKLLEQQKTLIEKLAKEGPLNGCHLYGYLLGVQTPFEHSTHADKFIYEVELRTGLGAHFRYAEHLSAVCKEFLKLVPEAQPFIEIGTAEPE
jgi:thymidylate synthase ThyX